MTALAFTHDGRLLASRSRDNTAKLWHCDTWETVCTIHESGNAGNFWAGLAFCPTEYTVATVGELDSVIHVWGLDLSILLGQAQVDSSKHYINAKVVLVGESGVGKSALGSANRRRDLSSNRGVHAWGTILANTGSARNTDRHRSSARYGPPTDAVGSGRTARVSPSTPTFSGRYERRPSAL